MDQNKGKEFSYELYLSRRKRSMTQQKAAELLGISVRWYQLIENGSRVPGGKLLWRIMSVFEIGGKDN